MILLVIIPSLHFYCFIPVLNLIADVVVDKNVAIDLTFLLGIQKVVC